MNANADMPTDESSGGPFYRATIDVPGISRIIVTNYLLGLPLYAYYIVEVSVYDPGEIEGVLMDDCLTINGPYDSLETVDGVLQNVYSVDANLDIGSDNDVKSA